MNHMLYTFGRIAFGLLIAYFGIGHLTNAAMMAEWLPESLSGIGVPLIYLTGICVMAAGLSFIINKWAKWGGILLALYLAIVAVVVHMPNLPDLNAMGFMLRDLTIASGSLVLAGTAKS